jgi:DNA-binding NarL/FixJ family response regulator
VNDSRESNQAQVRVLLADDAAIIRAAVRRLLEAEPSIKVVGVAESFSQTIKMASSLKPDVVLLDLHMPDENLIPPTQVKSELGRSGARVLGMSLSSEDDEETRTLAETFGVTRLLDKSEFGRVLIPAILQREPPDLA